MIVDHQHGRRLAVENCWRHLPARRRSSRKLPSQASRRLRLYSPQLQEFRALLRRSEFFEYQMQRRRSTHFGPTLWGHGARPSPSGERSAYAF
jgi:hypothetical protein